jgi:S1-C subfamily serine protease/Flp pilus assembly protein TadD
MAMGHVRQRFKSTSGYGWRTERLAQGATMLALQLPINEGDSGGPVINHHGELIGMAAAILWPAQKTTAAIDLSDIRTFLCDKPQPDNTTKKDEQTAYSRLASAIVWVQAPSSSHRATGFMMDKSKKLILTTAQAAGPHERIEMIFPKRDKERLITEIDAYKDSKRISARVILRDQRANLALLEAAELPDGTSALELAKESPHPGETLHTIGNPNGLEALWVYSALSVRQNGSTVFGHGKDDPSARVLILQAPGSGKDSGGPIVNADGNVVAVASGKDGEQQVTYGIALVELRMFLDKSRAQWDPQSGAEFCKRGEQRLHIGWLSAAHADFTTTLQRDPTNAVALVGLVEAWRRSGQKDKARQVADRGFSSVAESDRHFLLMAQATLLLDDGKLDKPLELVETALKSQPKFAPAHSLRAEILRRRKRLQEALADTNEAIWLDANLASAYLCRGKIHFDKREFEEAIQDFSRAVELEPYDAAPLGERARVYQELGETKKAESDENSAKKLTFLDSR